MSIRLAKETDLMPILAIENQVQVAPWTMAIFKMCFRVGYHIWVWDEPDGVQGFVVISVQDEECHILNLAVHRLARRKGFGSSLLNFALHFAKEQGADWAYLEVREANVSALKLYQNEHFSQIGRRKNYYPVAGGREDALVLAKDLSDLV